MSVFARLFFRIGSSQWRSRLGSPPSPSAVSSRASGSTLPELQKSGRFPAKSDVVRGMSVKSTLKGTTMSETDKANTVAFHKKAVFEGDVENAFRTYAGSPYRQHNPLIEEGMYGLCKFVAWIR